MKLNSILFGEPNAKDRDSISQYLAERAGEVSPELIAARKIMKAEQEVLAKKEESKKV